MLRRLLFVFLIGVLIINQFGCKEDSFKFIEPQKKSGFIHIEDNRFILNEEPFFSLMVNYVVDIRRVEKDKYIAGPLKLYEKNKVLFGQEKIQQQMDAHVTLIKKMGFNTVRLVFNRAFKDSIGISYGADGDKLYIGKDNPKIIKALDFAINTFKKHDIKVMLLIKEPVENKPVEDFTIELLKHYKEESTIFAYDFFNEPLFFDKKELLPDKRHRSKTESVKIVRKWHNMIRENAPYQLLTIGLAKPIEVLEWDPYLFPVDFLAFHTYKPLQVPNEIYWYSKYSGKPWMIGETGLPADNDSITYEEQRRFFVESYKRAVDCGGMGYGWWQFQNTPIKSFKPANLGVTTNTGQMQIGDYTFTGTIKPMVNEIPKLKKYKSKNECPCHSNYHNILGYRNIVIKGKVVDENNNPIEGAVVRGWSKWWSIGVNAYTDATGSYTMYSNNEMVHFEASAPGMTKLKFNFHGKYKKVGNHNTPFNKLPNPKREIQTISYKEFMIYNNITDSIEGDVIFNFDTIAFNNALYISNMKPIVLEEQVVE